MYYCTVEKADVQSEKKLNFGIGPMWTGCFYSTYTVYRVSDAAETVGCGIRILRTHEKEAVTSLGDLTPKVN